MGLEGKINPWFIKGTKPLIGAQRLDMMRVENKSREGAGTPDRNGNLDGDDFWIEDKASRRPAKPTSKIKIEFRPRQIPWLKKRWAAGGSCYVFLTIGEGNTITRHLVRGDQAYLLKKGLTEAEIIAISIIPVKAGPVEVITTAARYRKLRKKRKHDEDWLC